MNIDLFHGYLISHKSEALKYFQRYLVEVEKILSKGVKTLINDYGCEYMSSQFKQLSEQKGIIRHFDYSLHTTVE